MLHCEWGSDFDKVRIAHSATQKREAKAGREDFGGSDASAANARGMPPHWIKRPQTVLLRLISADTNSTLLSRLATNLLTIPSVIPALHTPSNLLFS